MNETIACEENIKHSTKDHKKLSAVETGSFDSCKNPIFGTSPDGIISCECHESALLKSKSPWTDRDKSKFEKSCLGVIDNIIALKKSHSYYFQVQMQLAVTGYSWCDCFLCMTKDSLQQKIYFDDAMWLVNNRKLELFYSKVVVKELLRGNLNTIEIWSWNSCKIICFLIFTLKSFSDTQ